MTLRQAQIQNVRAGHQNTDIHRMTRPKLRTSDQCIECLSTSRQANDLNLFRSAVVVECAAVDKLKAAMDGEAAVPMGWDQIVSGSVPDCLVLIHMGSGHKLDESHGFHCLSSLGGHLADFSYPITRIKLWSRTIQGNKCSK